MTGLELDAQAEAIAANARSLRKGLGIEAAQALVQEAIYKKKIQMAREDPNEFVQLILKDEAGNPITQAPFHAEMQRFIPIHDPKSKRLQLRLLCYPRDHGKTTQMLGRDCWEMGYNPNTRLKVVGATAEAVAQKVVAAVRDLIDREPMVREVFPHLKKGRVWSGNALTIAGAKIGEKEHTIEAVSITSAGAGGRADEIHFDDVCNYENSVAKPAIREKIIETFDSTWINLLEPWGRAWYVYTPWHQKDLSASLSSNGSWQKIIRPCMTTNPLTGVTECLWPSKFDEETLEDRKRAIGPRSFAKQFMLQAIADEDMIFDDAVLKPSLSTTFAYKSKEYEEFVAPMPKVMGVDLASSLSDKGCFTVLMTCGIGPDGRLWIVDVHRGRWKAAEIHAIVYAKWKQYNHQMVVVENNAFQSAVVSNIERAGLDAFRIPVVGFTTTGEKKYAEGVGVRGMAVAMYHAGWGIPVKQLMNRGPREFNPEVPTCLLAWPQGDVDMDPVAVFLRELMEYTETKQVGYSDTVMSAWFANWAYGAGSIVSSVIDAAGRVYT